MICKKLFCPIVLLLNVLWCLEHIEVTQRDIFMEQKVGFGLVLGRLAVLKKKFMADYEQFLCFQGQNFFFKYCSVRTKKLHNISFIIFLYSFKNFGGSKYVRYSQLIVSCSTGDTSLHNFYIMTLFRTY